MPDEAAVLLAKRLNLTPEQVTLLVTELREALLPMLRDREAHGIGRVMALCAALMAGPKQCRVCLGDPCSLEGTPKGPFIAGAHVPIRERTMEELDREAAQRERLRQEQERAEEERRLAQDEKRQQKEARRAKWVAEGGKRKSV